MEPRVKDNIQAARQLPKLKSLLKKYRQVKTMQAGLLQLSELASTVTEMSAFYQALESVISTLLITDNFHITLLDPQGNLTTAFCHNPQENRLFESLDKQHWQKTLTGVVFEECEPVHCTAAERRALAKTGTIALYNSSCEDWLGVPLSRGKQVIGVIALQSYDKKLRFDDRDCQLLEFIAEHLVTAIDRVRDREQLEKTILQRTKALTVSNQQLQQEIAVREEAEKMHKVLLNIAEITMFDQNIEQFYQALHQEIKTLIPAENFYIALLSNFDTAVEFPYFIDERSKRAKSRKLSNGLTEMVIQKEKPLLVRDGQVSTLCQQEVLVEKLASQSIHDSMPKAWLGAPLIDKGKVFGVLAIQHYQDADAYKEVDAELIQFASQHISIAIMRKRAQDSVKKANEQLERLVKDRTKELEASNLNLRMQIEERRKAEAQLYFEAHHDALTKLPNRAMLSDRLQYALRHLKRHPNHRFALLFIDLDRFKIINDTLGHHAGDQFLIEIAQRLKMCVRDNDILARLGGDEFVVLLDSFQTQEDVEDVCARIIQAIEQPFDLEGHTLYSNASIGIALCGNQYNEAHEILRDADAAMYQAKSMGRGRYVFFDESMREQLIASMTLEQELRIAIKEQQFELHYQKITDLNDGNYTIGYEGLLRWNHPTKGLLTPSEFLFMAEETGMILEIENWVVEEVSYQLLRWQNSEENRTAFIGINLSGRHLTQANQLNRLIELITRHNIEPQRLILEFNESAFMKHGELALKGLRKLKEFGVKLALDDYGAGTSSFNFLHHYPFEFIKLDRSFIKSLDHDEKNISLVKALNELGDQFGYRIVAEGIETEKMMNRLKDVGCEFGQGYYISRPKKVVEDNVVSLLTPVSA